MSSAFERGETFHGMSGNLLHLAPKMEQIGHSFV